MKFPVSRTSSSRAYKAGRSLTPSQCTRPRMWYLSQCQNIMRKLPEKARGLLVSYGSLSGSSQGQLPSTFSALENVWFCQSTRILQEGSCVPWPLPPEGPCKPRTHPTPSKSTIILHPPHLKGGKEQQALLRRPNPWASLASACGVMWLWLPPPARLVHWASLCWDPTASTLTHMWGLSAAFQGLLAPGSTPGPWHQLTAPARLCDTRPWGRCTFS